MSVPLSILTAALSKISKPIFDWFSKKWEDEKAFQYAKEKLRKKYEEILEPANYDGIIPILKVSKIDIDTVPISAEGINLISHLKQLLLDRISIWEYNRREDIVEKFIEEFIDASLEYHLRKGGVEDKVIFDRLTQLIDEKHQKLKHLEPLHTYISFEVDFNPLKNIFDNYLLYFTTDDLKIISDASKILLGSKDKKVVLLDGQPASGKTYLSLYIGTLLLKKNYEVYYVRLNEFEIDNSNLIDDLYALKNNSLVVIDNCQDRIDIFVRLCKTLRKFPKISFLFVSNDFSNLEFNIGEFDEFNVREIFKDSYFHIPSDNFEEKAKGIIIKHKDYIEKLYNKPFEIGKLQFVINNAHQSLVTLYFNLMLWPDYLSLDQVDKNKVFEKLYRKYFGDERELNFMLIIASLYKYEIYFDASEKYSETALELSKKGIIKKAEFSNFYYLYHSSFAKLLLNAYSINKEYKKKYKNQEEFVYHKIREYILSFKEYPQNLDNIFYYLNANHGLKEVGVALLRNEDIITRFLEFYKINKINVELYLFLLYRLSKSDTNIAERLITGISDEIWKRNLFEMSFHRLSLSLLHLDRLNPDKASSIVNSVELEKLVQKIKVSNIRFHLLTNSIREIVKVSRSNNIGNQILISLSIDHLIKNIKTTDLTHLGKSISELHATNSEIAEVVIKSIEPEFLKQLIEDSNLKSYTKSLNEIKKVNPQLATIILNNTPDEILINQLLNTDLRLEALSRSLTELSKIDPQKSKKLFEKISTDKLLELIYDSSLIQISQSLSEFLSIDKKDERHKKKLCDLFTKIDDFKLMKKINHKSAKFHTIGNALNLFNIFDTNGKVSSVLAKIDKLNLLSKAVKSTFHEYCLGIKSIHSSNNELSKYLIDNYKMESIIRRANSENLDVIGSDLNKLSEVDKKISDELLKRISWQRIVRTNKNIKFTKLVDSITALSNYNKRFAQNLLNIIQQLFGLMFFVKRASYVNKNALLDSLNKLYTVDRKIVKHIVIELKKVGHI